MERGGPYVAVACRRPWHLARQNNLNATRRRNLTISVDPTFCHANCRCDTDVCLIAGEKMARNTSASAASAVEARQAFLQLLMVRSFYLIGPFPRKPESSSLIPIL